MDAFKIWEGGPRHLGRASRSARVGAWIGCRRRGIPLPAFADALAPGIVLAQAIGRLGQLVQPGAVRQARPTCRGRVKIDPRTARSGYSTGDLPPDLPVRVAVVHRRRGPGHLGGPAVQARATAGPSPCTSPPTRVGRFWIEYLRVDPAHDILGLRLNVWTAILVFVGAVAYIVIIRPQAPRP